MPPPPRESRLWGCHMGDLTDVTCDRPQDGLTVGTYSHRGVTAMADDDKSNNRYGWWGGLASGLVVILVGVVFLLRNLGIPLPFIGLHNWWALFIVLGAVPLLVQAADSYRKAGKVDQAVLHSSLSAL